MLKTRILTALVIAPIALLGLFYLSASNFKWFLLLILLVSGWEWANFARLQSPGRIIYAGGLGALFFVSSDFLVPWLAAAVLWWVTALWLIAHYPSQSARWQRPDVIGLIGVVTLIPCGASLVWLKAQSDAATVLLLLLVLIWSADIGAYFVGRRFGQRKLLPNVSPGKSVEGLVGGLVIAVIAGFATLELMPKVDGRALGYAGWLWLFLGIGLISVLGDLTLSMFKRSRGIKDSSQLLPGHGGFLDRLDSVFSAAPIYCGLLYLTASFK